MNKYLIMALAIAGVVGLSNIGLSTQNNANAYNSATADICEFLAELEVSARGYGGFIPATDSARLRTRNIIKGNFLLRCVGED